MDRLYYLHMCAKHWHEAEQGSILACVNGPLLLASGPDLVISHASGSSFPFWGCFRLSNTCLDPLHWAMWFRALNAIIIWEA
jgi:hypothetical protein